MTLSESTLQPNIEIRTKDKKATVTDFLDYKPDTRFIRHFLRLFTNNIICVGTVIAGPIVILAITIALETIQSGHDRVYDTVSGLVWGHMGWLVTGCFYLFALVLITLALNLNRLNIDRRSLRFAVLMSSVMSAGFVTIAVIPTNAPGEPATLTVFIHRFTAGLICVLFPVICLSIARGLWDDFTSKRIRNFSLITGGIGIVLSIAGMVIIVTETPWKGAIERIILANGILWIEVIGIRLMLNSRTSNLETKKMNHISENNSYSPTEKTAL